MAANELVQLIVSREKNILEIIELLGEKLLSGHFEERKLAVRSLVDVLEALPISYLNKKELMSLLSYLMEKISDQHVVTEVLNGLVSLIKNYGNDFSDDEVQNLLHKLFHELDNQSLLQSQRFLYYTILELFINCNKTALKNMGHDFVFGFIQSMDGEKDPRSLVIAFKLATIIAKEFDITRFAEEFFDIIACYFPIDFSPLPNDPHGITRELLESMNRSCLCASPKFATQLLPLVLEKAGIITSLDGTNSSSISGGITPAVRREVLLTISELCNSSCPPEVLAKYEVELSSFIRRVVFITPDESSLDGNGQAFQCCEAITRCLVDSIYLQQWVSRILREARPYLFDPQGASFVAPARALLVSCARATPLACSQVLDNLIPLLISAVKTRMDEKAVKCALLDVLCCLLQVAALHSLKNTCLVDSLIKYKSALLDEAYGLSYAQCSDNADATLTAFGFSILGRLLQFSGLLSASDNEKVIHFFTEKLISSNCESVLSVLIPAFVQYCQNELFTEPVQSALTHIKIAAAVEHCTTSCVQFLAQIGSCTSLQEDILSWFCSTLPVVKGDCERVILWQGVEKLVELVVSKTDTNVYWKLWTILRTTLLNQLKLTDIDHVGSACTIIHHLLSSADIEIQHQLLKDDLLLPFEVQFLAEVVANNGPLLQLLNAIVFAVRPEVIVQFVDVLLKPLLNYFVINRCKTLLSEYTEAELTVAICCVTLVNKSISRKCDDPVAQLVTACASSLRIAAAASQTPRSCSLLWTSLLCRAVLLAGHSMATEWLQLLCDYWPRDNVSGYALILSPLSCLRPNVTEPEHAVCNPVAAQRCLLFVQSLLLQKLKIENMKEGCCEIDLDACRVASHFSQLVLAVSNNSSMLSALKECSGCVEKNLWWAAPRLITLASSTCRHGDDYTLVVLILRLFVWLASTENSLHAQQSAADSCLALVPQLLQMVRHKTTPTDSAVAYSPQIRVAALLLLERCIGALSLSDRAALRIDVLRSLQFAVDDPKRFVRREAMLVRNRWFLLDAK